MAKKKNRNTSKNNKNSRNKKNNRNNKNSKDRKEQKPISLIISLIVLYLIVVLAFNMFKAKSVVGGFENVINNFKINPLGYFIPMIAAAAGILIGRAIGIKYEDKEDNK